MEMMAAGLVIVAHNSGGPLTDVVRPSPPSIMSSLTSSLISSNNGGKDAAGGITATGGSTSKGSKSGGNTSGGTSGEGAESGAMVDVNTTPIDNSRGRREIGYLLSPLSVDI